MQPCNPNAKLETKCLHAGYTPKNGGPGTVPIVQSTTYRFDSTEKVAELFDMPMEPATLSSRRSQPWKAAWAQCSPPADRQRLCCPC